jgi:hypothetical protein
VKLTIEVTGTFPKLVTEYSCSGEAEFEDGTRVSARFSVDLLPFGMPVGVLQFSPDSSSLVSTIRKHKRFCLSGTVAGTDKAVFLYRCEIEPPNPIVPSLYLFHLEDFFYQPTALQSSPSGNFVIRYAVLGLESTQGLSLETDVGTLRISHPTEIEELKHVAQDTRNPLINALGQDRPALITSFIDVKQGQNHHVMSLGGFYVEATDLVEAFLRMTSLAHKQWYDWCACSIYELVNEEEAGQAIFSNWSTPKNKPITRLGTLEDVRDIEFVKSAMAKYSVALDEQFEFRSALEWYLISRQERSGELKILAAVTALELLLWKHDSMQGANTILDRSTFDSLRDGLRKIMDEMGLQEEKKATILKRFAGLNERPVTERLAAMLTQLGCEYGDLGVTLNEIYDMRNKIIHRGLYRPKEEGRERLEMDRVDSALDELTLRVLLSILRYDGFYYSDLAGDWVRLPSSSLKG